MRKKNYYFILLNKITTVRVIFLKKNSLIGRQNRFWASNMNKNSIVSFSWLRIGHILFHLTYLNVFSMTPLYVLATTQKLYAISPMAHSFCSTFLHPSLLTTTHLNYKLDAQSILSSLTILIILSIIFFFNF